MTRVLTCGSVLSATLLQEVPSLVRAGALLAAPTESSYAFCVSPFNARAVDRLCALKGRPDGKPILVMIGSLGQLSELVASVPPAAEWLMTRCWPGPLTMVLPGVPALPPSLTAGTGTLGVRLPAFPLLTRILEAVGPLTGTSANRAGEAPLMTAQEVATSFSDEVEAVLDLGPAHGGLPSTLVAFEEGHIRLLREGPVRREALQAMVTAAGFRMAP